MRIIKPVDMEITVSSANTVYDAAVVRIYSNNENTISIATAGTIHSTFTIPAGGVEILEKIRTDTISPEANTTVLCTPVSYK